MNRIINNPDQVVEDMLRGYLRVHGDLVSGTDNPRVVRAARAPIRGKVGVVTGGGSGHEPAFLGYVGNHLVDAVAVGEIFSSPTANSFYDAFKAAPSRGTFFNRHIRDHYGYREITREDAPG